MQLPRAVTDAMVRNQSGCFSTDIDDDDDERQSDIYNAPITK